ncbi:mandelate racemase/muconate lactonizing enzyme family protein, partial [Candidatus Latescibacterota bacterium]
QKRRQKMVKKQSRRSFFKKGSVAATAGAAMLSNFGSGIQAAVNNTAMSSNPSELRIENVTCAYMRGHGTHMFVKITTNQGITGYGEAMDAVNGTYYIVQNMGRMLRGRNPLDVNRLFDDIRQMGFFGGSQSGIYVSVLTGIEFALWDLAGKALGLPVYRLLGGKYRDKIRIYCDTAHSSEAPEVMAKAAVGVKEHGFTAIKFDCDWAGDPSKQDAYNWTATNGEIDRMNDQFTAVREAIGMKMDLCVDAHGRYDLPGGIQMAKMFEKHRLMWLEEPVHAENLDTLREITRQTTTPICTGENHYLAHDFRKILEKQAADILMPDLHKCGGIAEGQRIANLANLYYVPIAPHNVSSPLGTMGACHCCAAVPNFLCMEWHHISRWDRWNSLIEEEPLIQEGYVTVSEKPGIGVTPIEEEIKKTAVRGMPFFE